MYERVRENSTQFRGYGLERMRKYMRTLRSGETSEAREARLERVRDNMQSLRSEETSEARTARLECKGDHARQSQNRGSMFDGIVGNDIACPVFGKKFYTKKMQDLNSLPFCSDSHFAK